MRDGPRTASGRHSRPFSRRDALRYATAVPALAGLGAVSAAPAAAARPTLI
ncbi:MAG: twin-arginine translocation signal domain-containing protein, partial [Phycisphaerae bacterium]|nr:twin-arginine translocation signal domain-containing protein [Phycisphaerae bacterium]